MKPVSLELHIEELVIEGIEGVDGARVGKSVERQLSRLFIERGLPHNVKERRNLALPNQVCFEVSSPGPTVDVEMTIARGLYGAMDK